MGFSVWLEFITQNLRYCGFCVSKWGDYWMLIVLLNPKRPSGWQVGHHQQRHDTLKFPYILFVLVVGRGQVVLLQIS